MSLKERGFETFQQKELSTVFVLIYSVFAFISQDFVILAILLFDLLFQFINLPRYSLFSFLASNIETVKMKQPVLLPIVINRVIVGTELLLTTVSITALLMNEKTIVVFSLGVMVVMVLFHLTMLFILKERIKRK